VSFNNIIMPSFLDSQGRSANPAMTLANQTRLVMTPFMTLLNALQACSSCNLVGAAMQTGGLVTGTGTAGSHPLAIDQCRIQLASSYLTGFISVPGPVDEMFLSDGVTLNPAASIVVALQAAIFGILGDVEGHPWTTIEGGRRRQVAPGPGSQ